MQSRCGCPNHKQFDCIQPRKEKETVKHVSFNVRRGEIVCLAGIEGNGQTDLIYAITGLCKAKEGEIVLHNVKNQKYSEKKN